LIAPYGTGREGTILHGTRDDGGPGFGTYATYKSLEALMLKFFPVNLAA
jgi:hypothetical protein